MPTQATRTPADTRACATRRGRAWPVLLVVAAGVVVYANSLRAAFVFDDLRQIVDNEDIRDLAELGRVWRASPRPVVNLSLAVNYAIGALDPFGYHLLNVVIHLLAGMTLYGVIRRTLVLETFRRTVGESAHWLALAVALLWVVHPLQTQSVTYSIQRAESLMGLFYLLTLYCVVRGATTPERGFVWYVAAVAACAAGMGSKAVMITAPIAVWLFDSLLVARSFREAARRRWVLYVGLLATWVVLWHVGTLKGVFVQDPGARAHVGFGYKGVTPVDYLATQAGVLLHYLRLSFWPHPLCLDYQWPVATSATEIVPAGLVIVALLATTLWALVRRRAVGFVGLWFFLVLAPTSSFIPVKDLAFEHRMYLPLAAVIVLAVVAVWRVSRSVLDRGRLSSRTLRRAQGVLVTVLAVLLGAATISRNHDYRSEEAMWLDVVQKRPRNARAWSAVGVAILRDGREQEALPPLQKAADLDPHLAIARLNLGKALTRLRRYPEAIPHYEAGLAIEPAKPHAINSLANAYWQTGQHAKAWEAYRRAIRLDPERVDYRRWYAETLAEAGRFDDAVRELHAALEIEPDDVDTRLSLARVFGRTRQWDSARREYETVVKQQPSLGVARYELGNVLLGKGSLQDAVDAYGVALDLEPGLVDARCNRGIALLGLGDSDAAAADFQAVLEAQPGHLVARYRLGEVLATQGHTDAARSEFEHVLRIDPNHKAARHALEMLSR